MTETVDYESKALRKQYGADLKAKLWEADCKIEDLASQLDAMATDERILAVRYLNGKDQKRLWELSEGRLVGLEDMVPASLAPGKMVRHFGRNSLPAFTLFEKRFCNSEDEAPELWGYNHQALQKITGPGYFVAYVFEEFKSLAIDYRRVPPKAPEGCPPVKSNSSGLSMFVYKNMVDHMRKVSAHVTIGRVRKYEKWQSNYFVLCREEFPES